MRGEASNRRRAVFLLKSDLSVPDHSFDAYRHKSPSRCTSDMLDQIAEGQRICMVTADGTYDTRACRCHGGTLGRRRHPAPQERAAVEGTDGGGSHARRCPSQSPPPWPGSLEAVEQLAPTKSGRDEDALLQVTGRARHVSRRRHAGCRASDQSRNPEPLHSPRNATYAARRIGLSKGRDTPTFRGFTQQSRAEVSLE